MRPGPITPQMSPEVEAVTRYCRLVAAGGRLSLRMRRVPGLLPQMFEGAPRDARIVVVGVCTDPTSEPIFDILKELNVQYVLGYTPQEFDPAARLIAAGRVDAASLMTARVGIDGVPAFPDLANPERTQDHRRAAAIVLVGSGKGHTRSCAVASPSISERAA